MVIFQDIEDVEEWLEPLDYVAFWEAVAPYRVVSQEERDHCDGLIADGTVKQDLILECMKGEARRRFMIGFRLWPRASNRLTQQTAGAVH